jgi:hypothetical protein
VMRIAFILFIALLTDVRADSDIRPDPGMTPLFQVLAVNSQPDTYENGQAKPTHHCTIDDKHPLLTVYELKDFLLEPDKEGCRIVFTNSDSAKFKKLTEQYPLLCLTGGKDATVILKTDSFTGSITFTKTHFSGPMAVYLRRRFHIVPGTNEEERSATPAPASPASAAL